MGSRPRVVCVRSEVQSGGGANDRLKAHPQIEAILSDPAYFTWTTSCMTCLTSPCLTDVSGLCHLTDRLFPPPVATSTSIFEIGIPRQQKSELGGVFLSDRMGRLAGVQGAGVRWQLRIGLRGGLDWASQSFMQPEQAALFVLLPLLAFTKLELQHAEYGLARLAPSTRSFA